MKITLKAARVNNHLTQKEVCEVIGCTTATLCLWEQGKREMTVSSFRKLCALYHVNECDVINPYKG